MLEKLRPESTTDLLSEADIKEGVGDRVKEEQEKAGSLERHQSQTFSPALESRNEATVVIGSTDQ